MWLFALTSFCFGNSPELTWSECFAFYKKEVKMKRYLLIAGYSDRAREPHFGHPLYPC